MDKDDLQEYFRFVHKTEIKPRKISSEYFKEESRRIEQKMKQNQKGKKKFHCFNQTTVEELDSVFLLDQELVARDGINSLFHQE